LSAGKNKVFKNEKFIELYKCFIFNLNVIFRCKPGLIDLDHMKPGRKCGVKVQECDEPEKYKVDCSENAKCVETDENFECRCLPGFVDLSTKYSLMPGRKCVEIINE
jgi:hypothetical protein